MQPNRIGMTNEDFCKMDTAFYGEEVDNIKQIALRTFNGEELKEYVEHAFALYGVSKRLWTFDCWDRHGKMREVLIEAYDAEHATLLFKANEDYEHLGFDSPY